MVVAQARHQKKPVKRTQKSAAKPSSEPNLFTRHARDLFIVAIIVVGCFALLAEMGALGPVGRVVSDALALTFGVARFALPFMCIGFGVALIMDRLDLERSRLAWGIGLVLVGLCGLAHLWGGRPHLHAGRTALQHAGGWLGVLVGGGLASALGVAGAIVVLLALLVVAIILGTGIGLRALATGAMNAAKGLGSAFASWWGPKSESDVGYDDATTTRRVRSPVEPVDEQWPAGRGLLLQLPEQRDHVVRSWYHRPENR